MVAIGGFGALAALMAGDAGAQSYPVKPVRLVVGFSAGGAADVTARLVGQRLTRDTGQQVVVENRTGASGLLANRLVAAAAPDGYTLVMVSSAAAIMPALRSDLGYDVERDLAPVALAVKSSHVLLSHPSVPVQRLPDLVALARANPGKLSYGSSGIGSANHMAGELLNLLAKVSIKHIPYKGGAENVVAAVSGETELTYGSLVASTAFIRSGKLRALGVTGSQRSTLLPQVPTLAEAGLAGYESTAWYGILAPAGVPRTLVGQLNGLIVKAGQSSELKDAYAKQGLDPQPHTPEEFGDYIRAEIAKNVDLVKRANLKPE
ncbi:MAG: tripartite tricarboxylate transporter substrate binding protein [Microbacteriaceae bacterium]|nr:tripartite tricarboxylate transporter substrate binding protein [Microbacteriaceae bacterium]